MTQANDEDAAGAAMISSFTKILEAKLREAASLARTANTLSADGLTDRAFQTLLDGEPLIHDASMLLNAISIVRRHQRGDPPFS